MRSAKVDANQKAIIEALRSIGAEVQSLASIGGGCPDLLVAYRGRWTIAEIKNGAKPPSARQLTALEVEWHERFRLHATVHIWNNQNQAVRDVRGW